MNIKKQIDAGKYARYDYSDEANDQKFDMLRKSTEMFNRRSITSSLAFRRKTASRESYSSGTAKNDPTSQTSGEGSQPDITRQLTPCANEPVEVTDIVDDAEDILAKKKPHINNTVDNISILYSFQYIFIYCVHVSVFRNAYESPIRIRS